MNRSRVACLMIISAFCASSLSAQNVKAPNPIQPIATVEGQPIYEEDLASSTQGQLLALRNQEYEIKRKALDDVIEQKLLEVTAKKKGLTTEKLLDQEVNAKIAEPSDAELEGFYLGLKDKIARPFPEIKTQLRAALKQTKAQDVREEYIKRLREDAHVDVLLAAPRVEVAHDPGRVLGNPKAPVMIVEFSDFQCPYCRQAEPTIKQVLAKYAGKVSLSYRDFPLPIHAQAELAAEAGRCAQEQGKFWEFHDQLFNASKLDKDALLESARSVKLDDKQFAACLASEKYKGEIQKDMQEATKLGVNGTPAFFINGIPLSGAKQQESFSRIIDDELARKYKNSELARKR